VEIPRMTAMKTSPAVQIDRHRSQENSAGQRENEPEGVVAVTKKFTANNIRRPPRSRGAHTPRNVRTRSDVIGTSAG
jgi:hypothetical protein